MSLIQIAVIGTLAILIGIIICMIYAQYTIVTALLFLTLFFVGGMGYCIYRKSSHEPVFVPRSTVLGYALKEVSEKKEEKS